MIKNTALLIYDTQECLKVQNITFGLGKSTNSPLAWFRFNLANLIIDAPETILYSSSTSSKFDELRDIATTRLMKQGLMEILLFKDDQLESRHFVQVVDDFRRNNSIESISVDHATNDIICHFELDALKYKPDALHPYIDDVHKLQRLNWIRVINHTANARNNRYFTDRYDCLNVNYIKQYQTNLDIANLLTIALKCDVTSEILPHGLLHEELSTTTLYEIFQKLSSPQFHNLFDKYGFFLKTNDPISTQPDEIIKNFIIDLSKMIETDLTLQE